MEYANEQTVNGTEFLNKAYNIAEEFCKLLWQRYKDTCSSEFIAIDTSGNGTIEMANICVSFQQHDKPDVNAPLEPATLSISIGTFGSRKRLTATVYPKLDENGNLRIEDWKIE